MERARLFSFDFLSSYHGEGRTLSHYAASLSISVDENNRTFSSDNFDYACESCKYITGWSSIAE